MKLLSISTDRGLFTEKSKITRRIRLYAESFQEFHVVVFTLRKSNFKQLQLSENVWIYPTNSLSRWLYIWDAIKITRKIKELDGVTTQDPFETGLVGLQVSKEKKIPLHVQIHTDFLSPNFKKSSFLNRIRLFIADRVIPRAKGLRVVLNKIKKDLAIRYDLESNVSVLPIYIDYEKYRKIEKVSHEEVDLLFVGRLEKEKRPMWAIDALKYLKNKGVDARLTFLGEGSLKKDLMDQASKDVVFVGYVDPVPYYAKADMVLVPSYYEGYGMVMVEASLAKIPVVANDVGVARELGVNISPDDSSGFSQMVWDTYVHKKTPANIRYPYSSESEYIDMWCKDVRQIIL